MEALAELRRSATPPTREAFIAEMRSLRLHHSQHNAEVEASTQEVNRHSECTAFPNTQAEAVRDRNVPALCIHCKRDIGMDELMYCAAASVTTTLLVCPQWQREISEQM